MGNMLQNLRGFAALFAEMPWRMSQNSAFVSQPQRLAALFAEQLAAPVDVSLKFAACRSRNTARLSLGGGEPTERSAARLLGEASFAANRAASRKF